MNSQKANLAHALDGGIPSCFHIERRWPAASDVQRLGSATRMENKVTITVAVFGEDSSFENRRRFRNAIHSALEQAQLGSYVGGGSMITDEPNYGIEFEIADDGQAVTLVRDTLRAAGVGTSAEIWFGGDRRYNVYDDSWTDLGPHPSSPQPQAASTTESAPPPNRSPQDLLAQLTQLTEQARKKYGGPKDPNRGA